MRFGQKRGKRLGGEPPRRRMQSRKRVRPDNSRPGSALAVLAFGFFVVGAVMGFGWAVDREIRGGILRQRIEAERRPDWVAIESVPRYVPAAFLAVIEPGLLSQSRLRAPVDGPTVARELVRQIHLLPNSLIGESRERLMGPVLEKRLAEVDLVELYLNRVYLGRSQGYPLFGIYHASQEYFDKAPQELTLSEAATLAALLLDPRIEDPENRVGAVGARRSEVLRVMRMGSLISDEEYRTAISEPLGFQPGLEQIPMTRPANWGSREAPIRLPPERRPSPADSTAAPA